MDFISFLNTDSFELYLEYLLEKERRSHHWVTSSPSSRKGLPMAKTNGNQVLPNVVPPSTTTAFNEGLTLCPQALGLEQSVPTVSLR